MNNHHKNYDDYKDSIDELRRLAREPYEASDELVKLRKRITSERSRVHRNILERVAQQAHVDLQSIFDEARRRNAAKHKYVTETLNRVLAQVAERAKTQAKHFHRIRADYVRDFSALEQSTPQLKFHQPISTSSNAKRGDCGTIGGYSPDIGNYDASAEFGPDPVGIWLFPFLSNDNRDCDDIYPARTLHDLTFQMSAPTTSFAVSNVRVDLIANGVAASHLGDPSGFLMKANPEYVHSFIDMDVWIAQQVYGEWHQWPLLSDRLFEGAGDYAKQVRLVLSGQTYPSAIVIRKPDAGGGDLLCHMQIVCSIATIGTDGRCLLDFRAEHGMFVGGVALLGDSV